MIIKIIKDIEREEIYAIDKHNNRYELDFTADLRDQFTYFRVDKRDIINNTINTLFITEMEIVVGKLIEYKNRTQQDFNHASYIAQKLQQLETTEQNKFGFRHCINFKYNKYNDMDCDMLVKTKIIQKDIIKLKNLFQKIINNNNWKVGYKTKYKDVTLECVSFCKKINHMEVKLY